MEKLAVKYLIFSQNEHNSKKNVNICGWSPFKKWSIDTWLPKNISIYEVMNVPRIIVGFVLIMR